MRTLVLLLLACAALRADFSYRSRVQITGGKLLKKLSKADRHAADAVTTTRLIKGYRMAILQHRHTTVIDAKAGTVTAIDFGTKTYTVTPLAEISKRLEQAEQGSWHESSFRVETRPASHASAVGLLNVTETAFGLLGAGGKIHVDVDLQAGTVPGYEQISGWVAMLAAKMGDSAYVYASGLADWALEEPESVQGFNEALRQIGQLHGAPLLTTIRIAGMDTTVAEATVEWSRFGGGAQDAAKFDPPANFKKVDSTAR